VSGQNENIKVMIVDDIDRTRTDIKRLLYFEEGLEVVGEAANGEEAVQQVDELLPDIILMDVNMPVMDGITATEYITRTHPEISIVIISIQGEHEYLKKAMAAGAREYMVKPVSSEEIASTLRQVYSLEKRRQKKPGEEAVTETEGAGQVKQNLITVFSGKGGVGKSVLASNFAVSLAKQEKEVVLVDLDLQFGDISLMLNLSNIKPIDDLVQEPDGINESTLSNYLMRHLSGLHVLSAPLTPQDSERVTEEHLSKIIPLLQERFDHVIIDTPSTFQEMTLCALDHADMILLPMLTDLSTIKNTRTTLHVLEALGHLDKSRVILNMDGPSYGVELEDIETSLGTKIFHRIPREDKNVTVSINKGDPVTMAQQSTELTHSIQRLVEKIINPGEEKKSPAHKSRQKNRAG